MRHCLTSMAVCDVSPGPRTSHAKAAKGLAPERHGAGYVRAGKRQSALDLALCLFGLTDTRKGYRSTLYHTPGPYMMAAAGSREHRLGTFTLSPD